MRKLLLFLAFLLPGSVCADDIAYAVFKDGTLTFKYGSFIPDGETSWDVSDTGTQQFYNQELSWGGQLLHVVFDSSFAQARPKSCFAWFDACKNLEDIKGLEYLNTSEVTNMACMFEACPKLTSLDLTHFNTSNVTDMGNMFAGAVGLTMLDISSFNTAQVTNMNCMFAGSNSPTYGGPNRFRIILVGDGWNTSSVTSSQNMFDYCPYLRGAFGTKGQNLSGFDKTYAVVDGPETPGYMTKKGDPRAYAVFSEGTLTFKYDSAIPDGHNWWNVGNTSLGDNAFNSPEWGGYSIDDNQFPDLTTQITKVVFEPSFVDARPISCFAWFDRCINLETIEGLEYLNTTKVTNMAWMFEACPKLTSLDLTHFDTSNVTDMGNMFAGHEGITQLDLSSFNTDKVSNMMYMFASLANTQNKLKTIFVGDGWTVANVTNSDKMFDYCDNLVGGNGTKYSSEHNDKTYANIDATNSPGYFSRISGSTVLTLNVATAGTLSNLISADDKYTISELKLTGNLNGTDLRLIREMAGNDYLGQPTNGVLRMLDMSEANIVSGGEKYLDTDRITSSTGTYTQNVGDNSFHYASEDNVLGNSLFAGCDKLEEVILPNSITAIGEYVFWYCLNLGSLMIPQNVSSIGWGLVYGPNNISTIAVAEGNLAFSSPANSNALMQGTKLILGCNNTQIPAETTIIGERAFADCNGIGSIILPEGVTTIESSAFSWSSLSSITLPSTLKSIGWFAFSLTQLETITIPASVERIDGRILNHCSKLTKIVVDPANTKYDSRDNCNAIVETATNTLIVGCKTSVIPGTVTALGETAFTECQNLESITIPKSIVSIGEFAFRYCIELKTIYSCIENPFAVSNDAFPDYEDLTTTLYVPAGTKSEYGKTQGWERFTNIIESVVEEEVLYIPNDVEKTVTVQSSFDESATVVEIQSSVTIEGEKYEVTAIGEGAFQNNENLEKVSIPETISEIGDNAFAGCINLKEIRVFAEEPVKLGSSVSAGTRGSESSTVFAEVDTEICILYVPAGSKEKYEQADGWKEFKNIVEMTIPVTIGVAGFTTHTATNNLDFSGFGDEVKAYVATGYDYDAGTIWLTRVKDVPAGTPIMVKGNAKETYEVPVKSTSGAYYKNMLVGNTTGSTIYPPETTGDMTNYYLSNGIFKTSTGTNPINPGKCYLQIPTVAPTPVVGSSKDVTMNKNGYASFCANQDLDFSDVEGLKAYAATGYDDASGTIWLTRVKRVSAGTGLLLMGAANGNYTIPSTDVKSYYANMMVGNTGTSAITIYTTSGDMTNYYLSGNKLLKAAAAGTTGNTINPGKAYMQIPSAHVTRSIGDDPTENLSVYDLLEQPEVISMQVMTRGIEGGDDDTTGIRETVQPEQTNDVYYNLNGQRVNNPGKGLYIHNGKKVVIK